ncbi:hypothetical protein [Actinomadura mexicana]|nr:hypothetical protein [Actinomadura mexicana]
MEKPVLGGVHSGASLAIAAAAHLPVAGLMLSGVPLFDAEERARFIAGWTPEAPLDDHGSQFAWPSNATGAPGAPTSPASRSTWRWSS